MRSLVISLSIVVTALTVSVDRSFAQDESAWAGDVSISIGRRNLDPDFWAPVEGQTALGIDAAFGKSHWPVQILLGASGSIGKGDVESDSGGSYQVEGATTELSAGMKISRVFYGIKPHLAGGVSWITAEMTSNPGGSSSVSDKDQFRTGLFAEAGAVYNFMKVINIGASVRYLGSTKARLFDIDGNADYIQYSLVIGWSW